jgi:hypothetical protein
VGNPIDRRIGTTTYGRTRAPRAIKPATAIAGSLLKVETKTDIRLSLKKLKEVKLFFLLKKQGMAAARRDGYDLQIK